MTPYECERRDQERCERQSDIAEVIYIDGFTDGLDGVIAQRDDEPYRLGHAQGSIERQYQLAAARQRPSYDDEF